MSSSRTRGSRLTFRVTVSLKIIWFSDVRIDKKKSHCVWQLFFSLLQLKNCLTEFKSKIRPYNKVSKIEQCSQNEAGFQSSLLELVGFRLLLNPPTAFIFVPQHARLSALKSTLLHWPTNSITKKVFHLSLSATSRLMVLSGFLLSDSVEREHQPP